MSLNEPEQLAPGIKERINKIDRLAAMPQVIWHLLDALGREQTTPADLQRIIEGDIALATKVLSLANSAYFGVRQKITTIERAIVIIGLKELELIILGVGFADLFDLRRVPSGFDGEGLWIHGLSVAWLSKEMAEASFHTDPGGVMLAGLLHDVGKLILVVYLTEEAEQILDLVEQGVPYYEAEDRVGARHSEIGYLLARNWGLPKMQSAAIRDHHYPKAGDPNLAGTCLVALADSLVKSLGFGLIHESPPLDQSWAMNAAHLSHRHFNLLAKEAEKRVPDMINAWRQMLAKGL